MADGVDGSKKVRGVMSDSMVSALKSDLRRALAMVDEVVEREHPDEHVVLSVRLAVASTLVRTAWGRARRSRALQRAPTRSQPREWDLLPGDPEEPPGADTLIDVEELESGARYEAAAAKLGLTGKP